MKRASAIIRGRVQGVFFRASARDEARRLGLRGWVRNRHDGSVELLAEGDDDAVGQLLRWCRRGPPGARVDDLEHELSEATGELDGFAIRS